MKLGDKVKVIKLHRNKEMNLWGGYDDVTVFLNQTGTITNHYDKGQLCEKFGLEFDDDWTQITRERTGLIFSKEQLEIIL
ncbi:hypothetical protein [Bacillus thuringiensis]|uniref:hypothetical protein n=1 Tax=Bacillus thuringiensis TaxID=1428 RepID=UPI000BF697BF|nr:hypothetical protein [Bacillus thuringiensis]PFC28502.1 hypothetical protein CN299_19725 [Bacillus thuringiensis]